MIYELNGNPWMILTSHTDTSISKQENIIISSCDAERDGDRSAVASDAEGYLIDDEEVD